MSRKISGHIKSQLEQDLRLTSLTLLGLISLVFLGPFAVYRLLIGDFLVAIVEFVFLLLVLLCVFWAWNSRDVTLPGTVLAGLVTLAGVGIISLLGDEAIYWAYVALIVNLVLGTRQVGLILNLLLITGLSIQAHIFPSPVHLVAFIATALLVSIYAFIFASLAERYQITLRAQAERDPLTGVGNRRMFEARLPVAIHEARNRTLPYSIAILDIDHFKQINDRFGHAAGDRVLQGLAGILEQTTRGQDQLFRIGGEEFALLMPETDLGGALILTDKIRQRVADQLASPGGKVTVSIGVAQFYPAEERREQWLERADRALYEAKRAGRDRVCGDIDNPD